MDKHIATLAFIRNHTSRTSEEIASLDAAIALMRGQSDKRISIQSDMLVSVDVSTCDDDAHHRIFARTTGEVIQFTPEGPMEDPVILCIEESRNFKQERDDA